MQRRGTTNDAICAALAPSSDASAISEEDPPLSCKLCKRFVQMVKMALEQDVQKVEVVRQIIGDICDSMSTESNVSLFFSSAPQKTVCVCTH